ncbi:MAG: GntR family transcriptional regulator [Treponema sp.]|jgi:GntR family transcriptional regulator|nr:GntR family transcriptional regulator [Treponema sp.]
MNGTISGHKVSKPSQTGTQAKAVRFSLDQSDDVPIYRQIIKQIEYAILSGRLKSGDKLPTIRSLAVELKTNPNTIAKAYGELEIRGILATQVGSGTYISNKKPEPEEEGPERKIKELVGRFIRDMQDLGVERRELARVIAAFKEDKR